MYKIYTRSQNYIHGKQLVNPLIGSSNIGQDVQRIHATTSLRFPPAMALKLPTNVDLNATEVSRFSPTRERDISGPVINSCYKKLNLGKIDITSQVDPHINKYDCRGAVSLNSSMQSNVPSPFSGNNTHLNMPGSQWSQGQKYLSDNLQSAHYLTLRNEYRARARNDARANTCMHVIQIKDGKTENKFITPVDPISCGDQKTIKPFNIAVGIRHMSTSSEPQLTNKDKLKSAIKEYGSTVIVFHIGISLISLGTCYLLVSSGVDLVAVLKYFNLSEGTIMKAAGSNAGTFVIAYAVHKFFAPFRIAITLTATPFIVRYLRNIGFIKRNAAGGGK